MPRVQFCPCCGRKIVEYRHHLNKILVQDLEYLFKIGGTATLKEMNEKFEMSHSELANFQKLRYFGLVEKVGPRTYGITGRGRGFLKGIEGAPAWVATVDAVVTEEGPLVNINGVELEVQEKEDFEEQATR